MVVAFTATTFISVNCESTRRTEKGYIKIISECTPKLALMGNTESRIIPALKTMRSVSSDFTESRNLDTTEKIMLLKLAMAEAEGESTEGKALVIRVVLNRVQSEDFPGTVEEVIFQQGQFSPVKEGGRYYTTEPNEDCRVALEMVIQGWDKSKGALYFESCVNGSWHSDHLEFLYQVGKHKFYR